MIDRKAQPCPTDAVFAVASARPARGTRPDLRLHEQLWCAVLLPGAVLPGWLWLEPAAGRPGLPAADIGVHLRHPYCRTHAAASFTKAGAGLGLRRRCHRHRCGGAGDAAWRRLLAAAAGHRGAQCWPGHELDSNVDRSCWPAAPPVPSPRRSGR